MREREEATEVLLQMEVRSGLHCEGGQEAHQAHLEINDECPWCGYHRHEGMNLLIARCPHCRKVQVIGNYTWPEIVAECGGEPPICSECGIDLVEVAR